MAEFHTVCRENEVREGEGKTVEVAGKLIALFREQGRFFAIDDVCPHMGASLAQGFVSEGIVTCPWHAWRFRLSDGAWADVPRIKIGCYPIRVENGEIQVQVNRTRENHLNTRGNHEPQSTAGTGGAAGADTHSDDRGDGGATGCGQG
jgi:nitrite reductase (NADH) small subunit